MQQNKISQNVPVGRKVSDLAHPKITNHNIYLSSVLSHSIIVYLYLPFVEPASIVNNCRFLMYKINFDINIVQLLSDCQGVNTSTVW